MELTSAEKILIFIGIIQIISTLVLGIPLWRLVRLVFLLTDYPLHRHERGLIIYPPGYEPGKVVKAETK